jgi:capsular exopolysaccharide synthesis family protein
VRHTRWAPVGGVSNLDNRLPPYALGSEKPQVLWNYRWWIAGFVVLTVAAALVLSLSGDKTYEATARVRLIPSQQLAGLPLPDTSGLQTFTETYAELARSGSVIGDAARRAGHDLTPAALKDSVSVTPQRSGVVDIKASAGSARRAARYANLVAEAFVRRVAQAGETDRRSTVDRISRRIGSLRLQLEQAEPRSGEARAILTELQQLSSQLADIQARPTDEARVIERAEVPSSPSSPKPLRAGVLGLIFGLILGSGLALLHHSSTNRFASPEDASESLDLPLLGVLPKAEPDASGALDAFGVLRTNLQFALRRRIGESAGGVAGVLDQNRSSGADVVTDGAVLLVTSPEEKAGKTYVTTGLARALAMDRARVVAVDGDLRRPTLHQRYDIPLVPGMTDFLSGFTDLWVDPSRSNGAATTHVSLSANRARGAGELDVLTAGQPRQDSSEMLSSPGMAQLVERIRRSFEVAVVNSPPVLGVADAAVLARYADGVILIVDSERTSRQSAKRALQALRSLEAPLLGIVFNRAAQGDSYSGYGHVEQPWPAAGEDERTIQPEPVGPRDTQAATVGPLPETLWPVAEAVAPLPEVGLPTIDLQTQVQRNPVSDDLSALVAVTRAILVGLLSGLNEQVVSEVGGRDNVKLNMLPRLRRPGYGDLGICFEYAVHSAIKNRDPMILDRVGYALSLCELDGSELSSILFAVEKRGSEQLVSTARTLITPESRLISGTGGQSVKLQRHLQGIAQAFRRRDAREPVPSSISGSWKPDLFLGRADSNQWVGATVRSNVRTLEAARGLRVGIVPAIESEPDLPYKDDARNLIVCPLLYDGHFMQIFQEGWQIAQAFIGADARLPSADSLSRPSMRRVARILQDVRESGILEVADQTLLPQAQPELLNTEPETAEVQAIRGVAGQMKTVVAPVPLTRVSLS